MRLSNAVYIYAMSLAVCYSGFFIKGKVEPKKVSINARYSSTLNLYFADVDNIYWCLASRT